MIEAKDIFAATNGGLDIILEIYPDIERYVGTKQKFKLRNERTASAQFYEDNGKYSIVDFGDSQKPKDAIDIYKEKFNLTFKEACDILAEKFNISPTLSPSVNKPQIEKRDATQEEIQNSFSYIVNEKFSDAELKVWGPFVKKEHMDALSWRSVKSYKTTKMDESKGKYMTTIREATPFYPIFIRECETFKKIYCPYASEKKYRFFYNGNKPQDFINGLDELKKAYEELNEEEKGNFESNSSNDNKSFRGKKLADAIICSGDKDAVNCLSMGHQPIWLNSETADFPTEKYKEIMSYVDVLYNIPDIDTTGRRMGRELASRFTDIRTVTLPEKLLKYRDNRGNPMKDLADYVKKYPKKSAFENLLAVAKPLKFWEYKSDGRKKLSPTINTAYFLNFLRVLGYGNIKDPLADNEILAHEEGSIVETVTPTDIRRFVNSWIESRHESVDVLNAMLNSSHTRETALLDLPILPVQFKNATENSQFFFFPNCCVEVTGTNVKSLTYEECGRFVRKEDVKAHDFERIERSFQCELKDGEWHITIKHTESKYFCFLINSSRIWWREELEKRKDNDEAINASYEEAHRFDVFGDRLSEEERADQVQNLISKIFSIGYLLHHYKDRGRPYSIWILEDTISSDGVSSGGSGKSFLVEHLKNTLSNVAPIVGKDRRLTDNQFLYEGVTSSTEIVLIDDTTKEQDLENFYSNLTGPMTINKKHKAAKTIGFDDSPKFVFTSNFVPPSLGQASTDRRVKFIIMSDYYHQMTKDNDYMETRRVCDDFNMIIGGPEYSEEMWNADYNFLMDCVQFYLSVDKNLVSIDPPLDRISVRFARQSMGDPFLEWAEFYFREDGNHVNTPIRKDVTFGDFTAATNLKWNSIRFTKALKSFVGSCEWIEELNPEPYRQKDGRYFVKENGDAVQMFYIKTRSKTNE